MKKKLSHKISIAIIIFTGLLVYANALTGSFQYDDLIFIINNESIRDIRDVPAIWEALSQPVRFIVFYTFALNYAIHGLNTWGYHLVNILIHLANGVLVYGLVYSVLHAPRASLVRSVSSSRILALFSALLFIVHPLQTQAVTYISQRFASLATFFYLLSVWSYIQARIKKEFWFFGLAFCSAVLGMLSKEIVLTLPLAIAGCEALWFTSADRKQFFKKSHWVVWALGLIFLIALIPGIYSFNVSGMLAMTRDSGSHLGDWITSSSYFFTQPRVILMYLQKLFVPIGQNLQYDFPLTQSLIQPSMILSLFVILISLVFAGAVHKRYRMMTFGILWFFLTLSVESGIIPIHHVIYEHRVYLPSIGFFAASVYGLSVLFKSERNFITAMSVIVVICGFLTVQRNRIWQNEITLWEDVARKSPNKPEVHNNLGRAYYNKGSYDLATEHLSQAIELSPEYVSAHVNRGQVYQKTDQFDLALIDFDNALQLGGHHSRVYDSRGLALMALQKYEPALDSFNQAIELDESYVKAYNNRSVVYKKINRLSDALMDVKKILELEPQNAAAYYNLGDILKRQGRNDDAMAAYSKSISLQPHLKHGYHERARLFSTQGRWKKALEDTNAALLMDNRNLELLNNRSTIYGNMGRFDLALKDLNQYLKLDPNSPEGYSNRGVVLEKLGRVKEAKIDFDKAIALKADFSDAYFNRGRIYKNLKQLNLAKKDFSKAIEINPQFTQAYFQRALCFLLKDQLDQAVVDYRSVLAYDPKNSQAHNGIGKVYFFTDQPKRAIASFDSALKIRSDYAQAYFFRAQAHQKLGQYSNALQDLTQAKAFGYKVNSQALQTLEKKMDLAGQVE